MYCDSITYLRVNISNGKKITNFNATAFCDKVLGLCVAKINIQTSAIVCKNILSLKTRRSSCALVSPRAVKRIIGIKLKYYEIVISSVGQIVKYMLKMPNNVFWNECEMR